jgi:hypothetical protein
MSRIRSIYPGQWTDEDFVVLSAFARLLTLAIRNEADDNGVFEWKPLQIKVRLFPVDAVDVGALLAELEEHRHIASYQAEGRRYGVIRNFARFNKPRRPSALYPMPEGGQVPDEFLAASPNVARSSPEDDERQNQLELEPEPADSAAKIKFPTSADNVRPYLVTRNSNTPLSPPGAGGRRLRAQRGKWSTPPPPGDFPACSAHGPDYGPSGGNGISWETAVNDFFKARSEGMRPFWAPFWQGAPPDKPGCYAPPDIVKRARERWLGAHRAA